MLIVKCLYDNVKEGFFSPCVRLVSVIDRVTLQLGSQISVWTYLKKLNFWFNVSIGSYQFVYTVSGLI